MATMTQTKTYRCGGCKGTHSSLADVKACCLGGTAQPEQAQFDAMRQQMRKAGPLATPRQQAFILTLIEERPSAASIENIHPDKVPSYTKAEASNVIKNLLGHPKESGTVGGPAGDGRPTKVKMPEVPEGHYAIPSATGNNDLDFFRVDRPTEGKWQGYTFVKRIVGGKPDFGVRGKAAADVLQRILEAGVQEAALRYGREIGRCCKCNRHLTDEASRAFGMGPDCRSNMGW